tara:strand:+ start:1497 stop:1724 length:228 start_codon:yes stop_codon:yes gene_type:complete
MTTKRKTEAQYAEEYILGVMDKLSGGTITDPLMDANDPDMPFVGFRVMQGQEVFNVWILRDPEGNGMGHLEVEKG